MLYGALPGFTLTKWYSQMCQTFVRHCRVHYLPKNGVNYLSSYPQTRFRSITKQYFRKADGVVVFYDVTMEASFLHIKNWMLSVEVC